MVVKIVVSVQTNRSSASLATSFTTLEVELVVTVEFVVLCPTITVLVEISTTFSTKFEDESANGSTSGTVTSTSTLANGST